LGIYEKSDDVVVWKLLQYVSPTGRKVIDDWRGSLTTVVRKADFDSFLRNLVKKSKWVYPDVGGLSGKHLKGLYELRWKSDGVPHRIGGYFAADDEFVMLIGWTHNKKKYDPPTALELILTRKKNLKTGEAALCEYTILTGRTT
jgi:hypothetical protein